MALAYVWLCPVLLALYSILCLLLCFSISAYHHNLPLGLPFISEIATTPPASALYRMMMNHIALLAALWMYLKHREFVSYFNLTKKHAWYRRTSLLHLCIGLLASCCLQISVNFPTHRLMTICSNAGVMALLTLYVWMHTIFSSIVIDANLARVRLLLVRSWLAAAVSSCFGSMIKVEFNHAATSYLSTPLPFQEISSEAAYEWGAYFSMCLFLLTDAYEFRNLVYRAPKLVIPGSPMYDAHRAAHGGHDRISLSDELDTSSFAPLIR
ncbi:unnamed protein product [Cylicocyclus nassatus]|uniref:CWH43-like N-terminal domain-containing protein n=1 Tax=Cylicocyclus nassatus TaxID=53992 RepID=A0AA36MBD3_CYLNA|nr:unnamed protein product [Cylicocyclus nassatus]